MLADVSSSMLVGVFLPLLRFQSKHPCSVDSTDSGYCMLDHLTISSVFVMQINILLPLTCYFAAWAFLPNGFRAIPRDDPCARAHHDFPTSAPSKSKCLDGRESKSHIGGPRRHENCQVLQLRTSFPQKYVHSTMPYSLNSTA